MYTVIETPVFQRYAKEVWTDEELELFKIWLANNPLAGEVIPGTGGMRKVRWSRAGMGKRGGARVVYYNKLANGTIALFIVYAKAKFDNLPAAFFVRLKKEFEDAQEN